LPLFSRAAREFADALATARIPSLLTEHSHALVEVIRQCRQDLIGRVPLLAPQIDELERWATSLQADAVIGRDGVVACWRLAELYEDLQRYAEMAAVLREGLVSAWTTLHRDPGTVLQPGRDGAEFVRQRESDEAWLNQAAMPFRRDADPARSAWVRKALDGASTSIAGAFSSITVPRNDIEHAGMNREPAPGHRLRATLRSRADEFLAALQSAGFDVGTSPPFAITAREAGCTVASSAQPAGFINCSNHPITSWSAYQLEAARSLGYGEPGEFPHGFPLVPPEATTEEVAALAADITRRLQAYGVRAAHVAGEFTLALALVTALEALGIACYAATTERISQEAPALDGKIERKSEFRFVAWRRYPAALVPAPSRP